MRQKGWSVMKLEVFDPAMCCSSGVCGADVDASLVQFAADVRWLLAHGIAVQRYNLSQQPGAFMSTAIVRRTLQTEGSECLPMGLLNGALVFRGTYPGREELARLLALAEGVS
jgi:hypothetical protein